MARRDSQPLPHNSSRRILLSVPPIVLNCLSILYLKKLYLKYVRTGAQVQQQICLLRKGTSLSLLEVLMSIWKATCQGCDFISGRVKAAHFKSQLSFLSYVLLVTTQDTISF